MSHRIRRAPKSFALVALLAFTQTFAAAGPPAAAAPQANFSLRSLDGATVSAASMRGKVIVLVVGALFVPPLSRSQVQGIQKLADKYNNRDVEVFWVSTDSESPKSKNYASDQQLRDFVARYDKVKVLRDPDGQTSKQLGADQVPALIVLDRQGNISGAPTGGLDTKGNFAEELESRLAKLL
ncbi:MAG: TlpA disulfide reductase family protein [Pyrinomonadaceae bacterium]